MQPRYWRAAWRKAAWLRHLFGPTLRRSARQTAAITFARRLAESLSESSTEDSPVSRSVAPVAVAAQAIRATFGPGLTVRLATTGRRYASSRMSQGIFDWASEPSEEISKDEAMRLRRVCLAREKSVLRTFGNGCSFSQWPTADASVAQDGESLETWLKRREQLKVTANQWATCLFSLPDQPTPKPGEASLSAGLVSPQQYQIWTTPTNSDSKGSTAGTMGPHGMGRSLRRDVGKKLNPLFVDWLMGLPIGWNTASTPFAPLEMALYRSRLALLSRHYFQALLET